MKRIVSLVLALAMVLSLCIFTTASADDGFVDGKFTETRHITVEVYNRYNDGGSDPTSSVYAQYIKQGMLDKYNVDVELVSVGRWTEVDDLNNLLATGDAPDVCVTYSYPTIQTFAGMDGIIDLNPLLTEYKDLLPDLWALLGDYNIYYDQDPETGSVWAIEAVLAESARINTFIRKDWLDKLNMAEPTTTEEWVAYLRAAKEAKLGGEQTVPYAMKLYENSPLFSTSVIVDSFLDFSKITKEDWYSLYHEQMPGAKEAYRLLNTLYNEGLISENFAIDNGDIRDRDLNQGYAGFYIEGPTQVWPDYSDEMKKNVGEDAEWIPVNPFVNPDGYTLHENYAANGICIFIPSWVNKETAVAAMKYMDWMAQPENMFYLQNGIEGVHYDHLNEDGVMVVNMNMRGSGDGNINQYLSDTIGQVFDAEYTVDVANTTNRELFASNNPSIMENLQANTKQITNADLRNMMETVYADSTPYGKGDYILTDDKAPVELLGMQVIDQLIEEEVAYYKGIYERDGIQGVLNSL